MFSGAGAPYKIILPAGGNGHRNGEPTGLGDAMKQRDSACLGLDSGPPPRSPSLVECGRCGRSNPSQVRYCLDCGSILNAGAPTPRTNSRHAPHGPAGKENIDCFTCGVENPKNASFCRECGSRVNSLRGTIGSSPSSPENIATSRSRDDLKLAHPEEAPPPPRAAGHAPFGGTMVVASHAPVLDDRLGTLISAEGASAKETPMPNAERGAIGQRSDGNVVGERPHDMARRLAGNRQAPALAPRHPAIANHRVCRACGAESGISARFCQLCGLPLGSGSGERPRSNPPLLPAADPLPHAQLVVIAQDGSPGRRYALDRTEISVGGPDCVINLRKDPYVSPEHARITYRNGRFHLEDRGSLNGVFVRLGGSVPLSSGDLLLLGLGVLRFEIVDESERNLAPQTRDGTRVFGTPAVPRYARLTTQTVEGVARDRHYLSRSETVLGREVGDIVFTDDPFMSRRHAAIQRDPSSGHFTIRDLGSSNGTFIALRGEHALAPGDHIRIGQHLFRLDVRDDR